MVQFERLVIENGSSSVAFDLHPRLTVITGLSQMERDGLVSEFVGALGSSRSGIHLELVAGNGHRFAIFRPEGAPHRVIDVDQRLDVTQQFSDASGAIDLLYRAGLDQRTARRTMRFSAQDLAETTERGHYIQQLARIEQNELWSAAEALVIANRRLEEEADAVGSSVEDAEVIERIEHHHEQFERSQAESEKVRRLTFLSAGIAALISVPWYGLTHGFTAWAWASLVIFLFACGMSITAGYHRLWSHQTYQAHVAVRWVLAIFGAMALQNSILIWGSQHRRHHLYVDDIDKDPYSAKRGFWFSHMGWILRDYPSGHTTFTNAKDLQRDPIVMFQHRHYVPLVLLTNFGLTLLTGWLCGDVWGVFLLGGVLRLVVSHHFTFFINSLAHIWGNQPYTDRNTARDNGLLAVLTFGEGYHNYHHTFPSDYRNGPLWYNFDPSKWLIYTLSKLGLASSLRTASSGS